MSACVFILVMGVSYVMKTNESLVSGIFIGLMRPICSHLGLEPLSDEFTLRAFEDLLRSHQVKIKPFLLNQSYVSGLGNIYVDEALWEAKIHPNRRSSELVAKEIESLHRAIIKVLRKGVENTGTSLGAKRANYFSVSGRRGGNQDSLNVFRRDGEPCPRCGTTIIKITVAQRGTHLCPKCQVCTGTD